jgi:hypothetical protein
MTRESWALRVMGSQKAGQHCREPGDHRWLAGST